jgi:hypothetical protein
LSEKLPFFPSAYPDELFYSVIARYHLWSGNMNFRHSLQDLFDSNRAFAKIYFPNRLNILHSKLPKGTLNTPDRIINMNSIYPFFRPFLTFVKNEKIIEVMKKSADNSASSIAGLQQSVIPSYKVLRYCPKCVEDDMEKYGEAYWHRTHQVFGVFLCPHHKSLVMESEFSPFNKNSQVFLCMDKLDSSFTSDKIKCKQELMNYFKVSHAIHTMLNNQFPVLGIQEITRRYIYYLKIEGFITFNGTVKENELIMAFEKFYGKRFLKVMNSEVDISSRNNWITKLIRPKSIIHPLRHILFINFLGLNVNQFFLNEIEEEKPFGVGPWICFNAASDHYFETVITNCEIKRGTNSHGSPVGTFKCSCGYTYSRKGPDKHEDDIYKVGKIISFGHVWEAELKRLRLDENITIKEISNILMVTPLTVIRKLKKMETGNETTQNENNDTKFNNNLLRYRQQWEKLVKNNPGKNKTELRKMAKAIYIWLHRHDQEWLNDNSPITKKRTKFNNQVNWEQRDKQLSQQVHSTVEKIKSLECKPVQLTFTSICKEMGVYPTIQYGINKLPKTKELIESYVESTDDFRKRRIRYVACELHSNNELVTFSKVRKNASLQISDLNESLIKIIEEVVANFNTLERFD